MKNFTQKAFYLSIIFVILISVIATPAQNVSAAGTCGTGGTVIQNLGYCIHTFTGSATFYPPAGVTSVELLMVGGGGSGGARVGGGGGAGGYIYKSSFTISGNIPITIGSGGSAVSGNLPGGNDGNNGGNTIFSTLTAIGGGGGGRYAASSVTPGHSGGSGGGSGGYQVQPGGAGTSGQGYAGANGNSYSTGSSGGGGGATGPGSGLNGGAGYLSSISGTATYYAGGGGGSFNSLAGVGGSGGGGNGSAYDANGSNGTNGLGGGGGGNRNGSDAAGEVSGAGGSGVVIVKYLAVDTTPPTNPVPASTTVLPTVAQSTWTKNSNPTFTWSGATDNVAVASYNYYFGTSSTGTSASNTTSTSLTPGGLTGTNIYYLRVQSVDSSANVATSWATLFTYYYDSTAPTSGSVAISPTSWTNGSVVATVTAGTDTGGSGIANVYCKKSADGTYTTGTASTCAVTVNDTISYYTIDVVGNSSSVGTYSVTTIDKALPASGKNFTTSPAVGTWTNGSVTATITAGDDTGGSGTKGIMCDTSSFTPSGSPTASSCSQVYTSNGTFYYATLDNAGNWSAVGSSSISNIDKTNPVLAFLGATNGGWYNTNQTITPNSIDASSGIVSQSVSLDNSIWSSSVTVSMAGVNTIYCKATDIAGNTNSGACGTVNIDKINPVLAFAGATSGGWYNSNQTITPNSTDAGAGIASQFISLDNVTFSSSVTVSTIGSNTIYCKATDVVGNTASDVCGSVNIDKTNPVLGFAGANNGGWYNTNQTITPNSTDIGSGIATQSVSLDNLTWVSSVTVSNVGANTLYCQATDKAGNAISSVCGTVNIDKTNPNLGFAGATNHGWYNTNQTITPDSTDFGAGIASQKVSLDGVAWSSSVIVSESSAIYCQATDNAGNAVSDVCGVVSIDKVNPVIGFSGATSGGWYSTNMIISPNSSDAGSGIASQKVSLDGVNWSSSTIVSSTSTIYCQATDYAGNSISGNCGTVNIDKINPVLGFLGATNGNWYNSNQTITPNSTDLGSGIASQQVSLDGTAWSSSIIVSSTSSIYCQAIDKAGNTNSGVCGIINIDKTNPLLGFSGATSGAWYNSDQTLISNATDSESGISSQQLSLDGTNWSSSVTVSTTSTIYCKATDKAGNTNFALCGTININKTMPNLGFSGAVDGQWRNSDATITPNSSAVASGIASQKVSTTDGNWQDSISLTATGDVYCYVADNAGNINHGKCGTVKIDKTNPVLNFSGAINGNWYNSNQMITPNSADAGSGIASQQVSIDGINWVISLPISASSTIYCQATDMAGNSTSGICGTVNIDKLNPALGFSGATSGNWYNSDQTITPNSTDSGSGLLSQQVSIDGTNWSNSITVTSTSTIYCKASDKAENTVSNQCGTINIDKIKPMLAFSGATSGGWYNADKTITSNSSDAESGLALQAISLDNTNWANSVIVTATTNLYCKATDNAGNTISNLCGTVNIDKNASLVLGFFGAVDGSWHNTDVTITPNSTDGPSGVASQKVSTTDSNWQDSITLTSTSEVYCYVANNAGSALHGKCGTINIDKDAPITAFNSPSYVINGSNVTISVNIGNDKVGGSGTKGVACSATSGSVSTADTTSQNCSVTMPLTAGNVSIYAKTLDNAGNWSSEGTATVTIVVAPPAISGATTVSPIIDGKWQSTTTRPTFNWNATDSLTTSGYEVYWGTDNTATTGTQQTATSFQPASAISNGSVYYLRIRTIGKYGLNSDWATYFTLKYDTSIPSTITSSTETQGAISGISESTVDTPSFIWTPATDVAGISGYDVYFGNNPNGTSTTFVYSPAYTVANPVASTGLYYFRVRSIDNAGNASAWKLAFTLNYLSQAVTNIASVTESHQLVNNVWQNSVNAPSFSWLKPDNSISQYNLYFGSDVNGTASNFQSGNSYAPSSVTTTGTYYLRSQTKSLSSKLSGWNNQFTLKYDIDPPDVVEYPVNETTGGIDGQCQPNSKAPSFNWAKPNDVGSGVVSYNYYWSKDPNTIVDADVKSVSTNNLNITTNSGGIYYFQVQSVDGAGNKSDWNIDYVFCYALADTVVTPTKSSSVTATMPDNQAQVKLDLPAGMSTDPLKIMVYDGSVNNATSGAFQMLGTSFNLEAISTSTNENVKIFDKAYTITVSYKDSDVTEIDPSTLKIFYHNPTTNAWEALSTSVVNQTNHTVSATVNHMSEYGLMGVPYIAQGNVTVLINGNSSYGVAPKLIDFGTIKLNGKLQMANTTSNNWNVSDPTGTGDGWSTQIYATDLISGNHSIPASNISIELSDNSINYIAGNVKPVSNVTNWTKLSNAPRSMLIAIAGNGMGSYKFDPQFSLIIPANAYAGSYNATVIVQMVAGGQ